MTVMTDLRNKLTRRKEDASDDVKGTQAERLKAFVANGWKTITLQRDHDDASNATMIADTNENDTTPANSTRFRDPSRPRPVAALEAKPLKYRNNAQRDPEVLAVVREIQQLFEKHHEKADQLLEAVAKLGGNSEHLADIATGQNKLATLFTNQLDRSHEQERILVGHLRSLDDRAAEQTLALGHLREQLEANGQHTASTGQALDTLTTTLGALAASSKQSTQLIAKMSAGAEQRDAAMAQMHTRTQKWMIGALIASGSAAVGAIILAAIALLV